MKELLPVMAKEHPGQLPWCEVDLKPAENAGQERQPLPGQGPKPAPAPPPPPRGLPPKVQAQGAPVMAQAAPPPPPPPRQPLFQQKMEEKGLQFIGRDTTGERMEVFELDDHPYYAGCQFHPEFKSRPNKPSPLFVGLLHTASGQPLLGS